MVARQVEAIQGATICLEGYPFHLRWMILPGVIFAKKLGVMI